MADDDEKLLTINQLAERLQVSRESIRRWRKAGKIKTHIIAGNVRFKLSEVLGEDTDK